MTRYKMEILHNSSYLYFEWRGIFCHSSPARCLVPPVVSQWLMALSGLYSLRVGPKFWARDNHVGHPGPCWDAAWSSPRSLLWSSSHTWLCYWRWWASVQWPTWCAEACQDGWSVKPCSLPKWKPWICSSWMWLWESSTLAVLGSVQNQKGLSEKKSSRVWTSWRSCLARSVTSDGWSS